MGRVRRVPVVRCRRVDAATQPGERLAGFAVIVRRRSTAVEAVRPGTRAARGIDALQGKEASVTANAGMSAMRSELAGSPDSQRRMDQLNGYPSPGAPLANGVGMGTGNRGASTGSQRCSLSTAGT